MSKLGRVRKTVALIAKTLNKKYVQISILYNIIWSVHIAVTFKCVIVCISLLHVVRAADCQLRGVFIKST